MQLISCHTKQIMPHFLPSLFSFISKQVSIYINKNWFSSQWVLIRHHETKKYIWFSWILVMPVSQKTVVSFDNVTSEKYICANSTFAQYRILRSDSHTPDVPRQTCCGGILRLQRWKRICTAMNGVINMQNYHWLVVNHWVYDSPVHISGLNVTPSVRSRLSGSSCSFSHD